jgi:phosducin
MEPLPNSDSSDYEDEIEYYDAQHEPAEKPSPADDFGDLRMGIENSSKLQTPLEHAPSVPFGRSTNTGPKGVLRDYENAKFHMATIRMREQLRRQRLLQGVEGGAAEDDLEASQPKPAAAKGSETDSDFDSDSEAFQSYKQERLRLLENSLPLFGTYDRVTFAQLASTVKSVHELSYVVIHVYENHLESCTRINLALEKIAPRFPHTRFLRIKCGEAMPEFRDSGLPTFLIYRGGDMIADFIQVADQMRYPITDSDVLLYLRSIDVLKTATQLVSEPRRPVSRSVPGPASSSSQSPGAAADAPPASPDLLINSQQCGSPPSVELTGSGTSSQASADDASSTDNN